MRIKVNPFQMRYLPNRQLRKSSRRRIEQTQGYLPNRQLRKYVKRWHNAVECYLPNRQLRKTSKKQFLN